MSVSSCNGCCWEGEEERERRRLCVEGALHWNQDGTICNKKNRGFSIKAAVTGSVSSPTRPQTALCLAYGQALTIGFRHAALFQLNHQLSRRLNHRHSLMEKGFLKPPKTSYFFWRSGRWQETEFPENSSLGGDFSRCGINFDVTLECVLRTKKISSSALYELTWQYL